MLEHHVARQHRSGTAGIEIVSLLSSRSFPRHAHDQFGVGVIVSGGHRSWSGVGQVEAGPGDVITVNPGEVHDGSPVQGEARAWDMLFVEPDFLAEAADASALGAIEITRPALRDGVLAARIGALLRLFAEGQPDALAVEQDTMGIIGRLVATYGNGARRRTGPPPFVARALRRLDEAPEEPVTLSELARLAEVSRFQLLRGFARAVGTTPHAYLVQQRVRLARRLLAAGRRPAEAALAAGFADQSHLTRAFARQLGVTPARYRAAIA